MAARNTKFNIGAWILLLCIVAFSVLQTSKANQDLAEAQSQLARSASCTEQFLGATVKALNERTQYSSAQADANVKLQDAQLDFLTVVAAQPPPTDAQYRESLSRYLEALREYSRLVSLNAGKADAYPYPKTDDYRACLQED